MKTLEPVKIVDVVGVGLNATDTVIRIDTPLVPGCKAEHSGADIFPGGQTASAIISCQQWGLTSRYIGKAGNDAAGALHREAFAAAGVEAHLLVVPHCESQQSVIILDNTGERTILHKRDSRLRLEPGDLVREWITSARILHIDAWDIGAAMQAARWAREAGVLVTCDLDQVEPDTPELLRNIDYVIGNFSFAQDLTGEKDLEAALRRMHRECGCKVSAATLGPEGCLAWDGERMHFSAAFRVPVVDSTGAGDTFRAGFIYGLAHGWPLEEQLRFASAAAALNCQFLGARGEIANVAEIARLAESGERYGRPGRTSEVPAELRADR